MLLASLAGDLVNYPFSDIEVERSLILLSRRYGKPPSPEKEVIGVARSILKKRDRGLHIKYDKLAVEEGNSDREKLDNALQATKHELRWNTRLHGIEWREMPGGKWKAIEDGDEATLAYIIEERCLTFPRIVMRKKGPKAVSKPFKFPAPAFRRAEVAVSWKDQLDPFILYLEKLPEWDGTPRIDTLLTHFFESESPAELSAWAIWGVVGGAIRRAYEPGAKHDEMAILVGPQGIGKSTFWNLLLPTEDWFSDNLNLGDNAQQRIESLMGNVECSELQGITRTELNSLKAFMSRSTDKLRRAYAHYPEGIPRRTIIVGSTNEENCLPSDPAGNRRFVPVRVDGPLALPDRIRTELPEMRDQMWAEGLERYRKGETSHFPTALKSVLASDSEQHEYKDEVLETDVADAVDQCPRFGEKENYIKLADVTKAMGYITAPPTRVQSKVINVLKKLGYTRSKHPKLGRVWKIMPGHGGLGPQDDPEELF